MFRIIQNSSISTIKNKVGSQVSQATTRNGINNLNYSSRRLNSTLQNSIEQDILKPQQQPSHINGNGRNYRNPRHSNNKNRNFRNNNNNNNNNYHNSNQRLNHAANEIPQGTDNPWFHELMAFEDCVGITYDSKNASAYHNPQFWASIQKAMELYTNLTGTPDFNAERVAKLIYLLHTGLRQNRQQSLKLDKKPDFDARNFHKDMIDYICVSLRTVASDIISNKNSINQYGAMHLITSFKELQLSNEAISIWENARVSNSGNVFLDPRVVGVILPLMYENGHSFQDIQNLFETSRGQINYYHPNLAVGMIRACLLANEINIALKLFEELCGNSQVKKFGYLTETHLSFIGESHDLSVANTFFEKALYDEMPYKVDLQVPYVKKFIFNTWSQTKDFDQVLNIWIKCWQNYGTNVTKGVSSSLNELFLSIFFNNFENDKMGGFEKLKQIIKVYASIKPLDEPFLNIIMTKCVVWQDASIISEIFKYYMYYNVRRTQVAYRVGLKAMGSIPVGDAEILNRWNELIVFSDFQGANFIHNADWAALRDATIASQYGDRVMLYAKLVKAYSKYSKDINQVKILVDLNSSRYNYIAPVMADLENLDISDIHVPVFKNIKSL
ncbi:hypothetical protein DASC09_025320 [Saccharomycopsis crataegensis]|uniref:Protein RMD9-like, mitochondrial n=1 Tax=Saccharomycopsis crataegensis TaxID=43959 RepID=A0AAV5QKR6_9ASCO|nr:hypothetical protein DASC09_025320 [Saccharomycopsis crataegensis]